ncbi:MAG: hypothetical protein AAB229_08135 [Candidatus Hydrogenedentota bacterium]
MRNPITFSALLLLVFSACAVQDTGLKVEGRTRSEIVTEYYRAILDDKPVSVETLRRALAGSVAIVEPMGWTASGRPFANVISGRIDFETRIVTIPKPWSGNRRLRSGRIHVDIIHIRSNELPEYFEFTGHPRVAFASIERDRIFLDHRAETDPLLFEEAFEHELRHLLDRELFGRVPPELLEARAMIRGLARGRIPRLNYERLVYALEEGQPHYREASRRILESLALIIAGRSDPAALAAATDEDLQSAAEALRVLLEL